MDRPVIDYTAPVCTIARDIILASCERVWHSLIDFERWPSWNDAVHRVALDGPLAEGSTVHWTTARGLTLSTTLTRLDPYARIAWAGSVGAMQAGYQLSLEPRDGMTRAVAEVSIDSGLARAMPGFTERALRAGLRRGLAALRVEAERHAV
ncbi:Polyketide cyclase / dehydrase and lipid transport [Rhodovulum sp. ES.010]|uniref:SRPBCC family protein n=1 Tax=Rhodovulum sp. ES.010 TaxID=1882821 RepID=UPI0009276B86|nr:SRPBCC family protein [Rhodovulum sp. ES.010]SIO26779.1 Polyketide cyclase / dehydrase and lipid transport [Rhodovulum sp. ES.010]